MPLDLSTVGAVTETSSFAYDAKTLSLYALGIGAKRDELDYLYEGRGPKVYPTFAVVPTLPVVFSQLSRTGAELAMVVHGAQSVTIRAPLPAAATLRTTGSVKGIHDLKRFAQIVLTTPAQGFAGRQNLPDLPHRRPEQTQQPVDCCHR